MSASDDSLFVRTTDDKALKLARQFHDLYEMMAHAFNYETREETRTFDADSSNGQLMVATCRALFNSQSIEFSSKAGYKESTPLQDYILMAAALKEIRRLGNRPGHEERLEQLMADLRDNVLTPEQNAYVLKFID